MKKLKLKDKRSFLRKAPFVVLISILTFFISGGSVLATSSEQNSSLKISSVVYEGINREVLDMIHASNPVMDIIRSLAYMVIKFLVWLVDGMSGIYFSISTLSFLDNEKVLGFISIGTKAAWIIFTLAIIIYAVKRMINEKPMGEFVKQIVITFMLIMFFPTFLTFLGTLQKAGFSDLSNQIYSGDLGTKILSTSFYDVEKSVKANQMVQIDTNIDSLSLDINKYSTKGSDLGYAIDYITKDNVAYGHELFGGVLDIDFTKEKVYNYSYNPYGVIISLMVVAFALIISSVKIGVATFEYIMMNIVGTGLMASDPTGEKGIRNKAFTETAKIPLFLFFNLFTLVLFIILAGQIPILISGNSTGDLILKVILYISMSYFLINGSDKIKVILDVDSGLTGREMMASLFLTKWAYRGAKSTFNTAHTGATMIKNKTADMIGERKAMNGVENSSIRQKMMSYRENQGKHYGNIAKSDGMTGREAKGIDGNNIAYTGATNNKWHLQNDDDIRDEINSSIYNPKNNSSSGSGSSSSGGRLDTYKEKSRFTERIKDKETKTYKKFEQNSFKKGFESRFNKDNKKGDDK